MNEPVKELAPASRWPGNGEDEPERVDERDTMFARMAREPGTACYADYYGRRPDLKAIDDRLRRLPPLLAPGGRHYDPHVCGEAADFFARIDTIVPSAAVIGEWSARLAAGAEPAAVLKALARQLGSVAAGCTELDCRFVYTHKGRFDGDYGRKVDLPHRSALVFLVEMDVSEMRQAPRAPAIRESARQYYRAAMIARTIEAALLACGHRARAHYDAHYDVILPPLAVAAGLGEVGRNNILVADRFGSRVRIGAVTTDLALSPDGPVSLGVDRFCASCRKCAENCPSGALTSGPKEMIQGTPKWPTDTARCYASWRAMGTDCGICMAVCPFSHRDTVFHALVRRAVRLLPAAAPLLRACDDLVYGAGWRGAAR